jgi:hypothetical protein
MRARLEAEAMRQAECAAMLIAVTRMLLNMRGSAFATWLRSIADDFDATDPDTEHAEDLAQELIRLSRHGEGRDGERDAADAPDLGSDPAPPKGRRLRHH